MTSAQMLWQALQDAEVYDFSDLQPYKPEHPTMTVPGVGTLTHVEDGVDYDDGAAQWVVFEYDGELFRVSGWFDSWGGESEWNDLNKVKAVEVTRTEYQEVKE
jgi:hypothetical protein